VFELLERQERLTLNQWKIISAVPEVRFARDSPLEGDGSFSSLSERFSQALRVNDSSGDFC
jgi:hypothetical protein